MVFRRDVCVIGAGPAGIFAANWLKQVSGAHVAVIGTPRFGLLQHHYSVAGPFSLVPILPPVDSTFPPSARSADLLKTTHIGHCESPRTKPKLGTFAHYSITNFGARSTTLASKQFGSMANEFPMLEVRAKIERVYTGNAPKTQRLGYVSGESPYVASLRAAASSVEKIDGTVEVIDCHSRTVRLTEGTSVRYGALVLTIPLPEVARLLGIKSPPLFSAAAEFAVAHCPAAIQNHLIYDCEPTSPIFRMVSPLPGLLVVQLALTKRRSNQLDRAEAQRLRSRIEEILDSDEIDLDGKVHRIKSAYPTDPPDIDFIENVELMSQKGNLVRLGRFAEWRYLDLHELDWTSKLGKLCT